MRATSLALVATLWIFTAPAFPRNGETGILIVVKRFETRVDNLSHRTIVICNDDWEHIQEALEQDQEIQIYFDTLGYYSVETSPEGDLNLHPIQEKEEASAGEESFSLVPRECPLSASKLSADC